jgi:hypothetical protein
MTWRGMTGRLTNRYLFPPMPRWQRRLMLSTLEIRKLVYICIGNAAATVQISWQEDDFLLLNESQNALLCYCDGVPFDELGG